MRMIFAVAVVALAALGALAETPVPTPATASRASDPTTQPSAGDAAADLVASFYRALLSDRPPTKAQEEALFAPSSAVRFRLVAAQGVLPLNADDAQDIGPMRRTPEQMAHRRLLEQKVAEAGPVVLEYCRKHKDWFVPAGMRSGAEINISSLANFVRTVDGIRDQPPAGRGFVIVTYVRDRTVPHSGIRTLVLNIDRGRIAPDGVWLGGFGGRALLEEVLQEERLPAKP